MKYRPQLYVVCLERPYRKSRDGNTTIIVWNPNRDLITNRANTIIEDPEASKYAWGIGFHWVETWTGSCIEKLSYKRLQH